jgi:hypothetical protein
MATASESDLTLTTTWSRSNFRDSFKRKSRRGNTRTGSDTGSIASSSGGAGDRSPVGEFARHNSGDSGRRLSLRLGGRKRSKVGLGRTESESGSDVVSVRGTGASREDVSASQRDGGGEEGGDEYYTEEEDDT